jgi:polar amino acid transport system ATP-binding protein
MKKNDPLVEAVGIRKRFGALEVLRGIDLTVGRGEVVALIGPSGSGKSTILRALNVLERIDSGSIAIDGSYLAREVDGKANYAPDAELKRLRRKMGMVFQSFNLFPHLSVLENVALSPVHVLGRTKQAASRQALELLAKVGLSDKAESYPCQISGGQKQRVAIARALAMEPELLCFDEPTSALDPELTGEVLKTMQDLAKENMTMLVVTHEISFARDVADRVLFMDHGIILEEGSSRQVLSAPSNPRLRTFLGLAEAKNKGRN